MTKRWKQVALAAIVALGANLAASALSTASAETLKCPKPAPKCDVQADCENQSECTSCIANPFGPHCIAP